MKPQNESKDKLNEKVDLQTVSLFVILAVLTGIFVLGVRWAVLAPGAGSAAPQVEAASK